MGIFSQSQSNTLKKLLYAYILMLYSVFSIKYQRLIDFLRIRCIYVLL
ncbi:hypothetical protein THOG11_130101 [Vibrio harveyi]|nr:hypothetical protein TH15OA1_250048 [Vibrio harveyi]CAH1549926.1 hypothetical protein THOD03_130101 [Vibrio harveyi]CAH1554040.1 hypothetical protein THOG11_130101 [Vibrio harveyi]